MGHYHEPHVHEQTKKWWRFTSIITII